MGHADAHGVAAARGSYAGPNGGTVHAGARGGACVGPYGRGAAGGAHEAVVTGPNGNTYAHGSAHGVAAGPSGVAAGGARGAAVVGTPGPVAAGATIGHVGWPAVGYRPLPAPAYPVAVSGYNSAPAPSYPAPVYDATTIVNQGPSAYAGAAPAPTEEQVRRAVAARVFEKARTAEAGR